MQGFDLGPPRCGEWSLQPQIWEYIVEGRLGKGVQVINGTFGASRGLSVLGVTTGSFLKSHRVSLNKAWLHVEPNGLVCIVSGLGSWQANMTMTWLSFDNCSFLKGKWKLPVRIHVRSQGESMEKYHQMQAQTRKAKIIRELQDCRNVKRH